MPEPMPDDLLADDGWVPGEPLDGAETGGHGTGAELAYPNLDAWVRGHLAPLIRRRLGGTLTWCAQWWKHPEAVSRLNALWQEWEKARIEGTMSAWWLHHADPHLHALMNRDTGVFAACKPDRHTELDPLPVAESDPNLWLGPAFSDPSSEGEG
ncbi:DUF4913 domain-containing protein [Carbonactinospora thermoautotrophica]|uniref:DUF4913 domain-containing protein n=1 Tax=Carbonactinospora thermoautotrophica TaxID=1469144 RepID=UPI000AE01AC7|nr:DUF4913 domain-containing protein [Carbonactinospora thermoautotrophica]